MNSKVEKTHQKTNKIINFIFTVMLALIICIAVALSFLSFIEIRTISQNMDIVKNNVWIEKTGSYDPGSSSFFNKKIEAVKKDNLDENSIKGELINRSGQRITEATIYFKLYDKDGNLVDWTSDSIKTWDSGEKWIYSAHYPEGASKYEFAEFDIAY